MKPNSGYYDPSNQFAATPSVTAATAATDFTITNSSGMNYFGDKTYGGVGTGAGNSLSAATSGTTLTSSSSLSDSSSSNTLQQQRQQAAVAQQVPAAAAQPLASQYNAAAQNAATTAAAIPPSYAYFYGSGMNSFGDKTYGGVGTGAANSLSAATSGTTLTSSSSLSDSSSSKDVLQNLAQATYSYNLAAAAMSVPMTATQF